MRITKLSSIVFVLMVVLAASCCVRGQTEGQPAGDLGGTSWELVACREVNVTISLHV